MNFYDYVAIAKNQAEETSIDYKAIVSYSGAVGKHPDYPVEDQLRIWIAALIDKGLSQSTRKRYVEKLGAIYKDFSRSKSNQGPVEKDENPFCLVRPLRDLEVNVCSKNIYEQAKRLETVFSRVVEDAKDTPALAVFLYMLFNASSDIEKAISLRTDEYSPLFPQLNEILDPASFHHRRRYVFSLRQTRKRMPQLARETLAEINAYLSSLHIKFDCPFSPITILSLWAFKARECGVSLSDVKSVLPTIPKEYGYLEYVNGSSLSEARITAIKKDVAEAFFPTAHRWYAMKLRRDTQFDDVRNLIDTELPQCSPKVSYFYPMHTIARKVGRKVVKEKSPLIRDILFLETEQSLVDKIDRIARHGGYGWIFRLTGRPGSDFSIIDRRAMRAFQLAAGEFTSDMKVELTQCSPVGIGRKVRIVGGAFAGYTGVVYDIKDSAGEEFHQIYIRLSEEYGIRVDIKIDSCFVEPLTE